MSKNHEFNAFPGKSFWPNIAEWLEEVLSQCSLEEQRTCLHQWFDAFLASPDADDYTVRTECLVQRNNLLNLITLLEQYPEEKRRKQLGKFLGHGQASVLS